MALIKISIDATKQKKIPELYTRSKIVSGIPCAYSPVNIISFPV